MTPSVLVVEDDFLIAMQTEIALTTAGFEVVGPVPGVARETLGQRVGEAGDVTARLPSAEWRPSLNSQAVERDMVGLDRNWSYNPACKMARP